jgi:hypothetical protein
MPEKISSKDWSRHWSKMKLPIITFGTKTKRNNPGSAAVHGGSVSCEELDVRVGTFVGGLRTRKNGH